MAEEAETPIEHPEEEQPTATEEELVKEEEAKNEESEDEEIEYECPSEFNDREEMRKMFVGGLDKDTADDEFKALFNEFGEVTDFIIIRKDNTKTDRLFGFITFATCDELEECLLGRPHKYKEKELDVKRAVPRGQDDGTGHFKVKKLHVANISPEFTEKELRRYLKRRHPEKYGKIEEVNFLKSKDEEGNTSQKNRGFGFITVSTEDFADRIAIAESKFTLNNHSMRISKAKPRNSEGGMQGRGRGGGKGQGQYGSGNQGSWEDWSGYGAGYGAYGAYGYAPGYAPGYGYDYYGGYGGYGAYGPARGGRGGGRFQPY